VPQVTRRGGDPHRGLAAHLDKLGHRHAERVAEPGQRGQVRIRAALLERDQHPLADARTPGQLIQRPAAIRAQRLHGTPDAAGQRARQVLFVRHNPGFLMGRPVVIMTVM
jgi:hypothetical protein